MTSSGEAAVRFARSVVDAEVGRADAPGVPDGPGFARSAGAFVTLETYPVGDLRGCIGIPLPVMPLGGAIASAARSACHDPRFPDLRASELDRITVEVTILTPPVPIHRSRRSADPLHGTHGAVPAPGPRGAGLGRRRVPGQPLHEGRAAPRHVEARGSCRGEVPRGGMA